MIEGPEYASLGAEAPLEPRAVRAELACARALLDELENVLMAHNEQRTRCNVVDQVADQLDRVANTIRRWAKAREHQPAFGSGTRMSSSRQRPSDQ
jgi:hypothetical protein